MAQQTINIGSAANDGTGDPLRTAFDKVNDNFTELYGVTAAGTGNNVAISGNSIISENSNGNIILDPNGTGNIVIAAGAELVISDRTDHAIPYTEETTGALNFTSKLTYDAGTGIFTAEDITINAATISSANSNQDITLDPAGTGTVNLVVPTQASVGSAGGASALPATPTGYIKIAVSGSYYVIPYYAVS